MCSAYVHSIYATVLASLADSNLPPIDQNTATFYDRYIIDDNYGGLAFEEEGERCAAMLSDPKKKVLIMGNHGVLVMGIVLLMRLTGSIILNGRQKHISKLCKPDSHCGCYLMKSQARPLMNLKSYPGQSDSHFNELKAILDDEKSDYKN